MSNLIPQTRSKSPLLGMVWRLAVGWWLLAGGQGLRAAETPAPADPVLTARYHVRGYVIEGRTELSTNVLYPLLAKYTGKNVPMEQIVRAASDLQYEYGHQGWPTMNIVIAPKRIAHGLVTFDVFPGAVAQILVAGNRYLITNNLVVAAAPPPAPAEQAAAAELAAETNNAALQAAAAKKGPKFTVHNYAVLGNTVLPPTVIAAALTNAAGAFGTNVGIDGIKAAATQLQMAYRDRGYVTVAVSLPPQHITNGIVKIQVTEGRLADIFIKGNHYFSSNNVMRSLPSLHTNIILNGITFQAELAQANNNQDRQIYPVIDPGPEPGTSDLTLKVKDRFPLHAKTELDNQSSPGTPALRINSSAVYDNLWQDDNALGIQYSFSPELYKSVHPSSSPSDNSKWDLYDQPLVANYSGFYRLPLGRPESMDDLIATHPGTFGYDEATRKFNLPPPSGVPDLTFFASRSTIDTGLATLSSQSLYSTSGSSLVENTVQEDLTVNNDLGFRLNVPVRTLSSFHSSFSGGLDYKTYELTSYKTNVFILSAQELVYLNGENYSVTNTSVDNSPVPVTDHSLQYLPLALRYDASLPDAHGMNFFGLGLSANLWHNGAQSAVTNITSSTKSSGHWVVLTPSYTRTFELFTNWVTTVRADGQWASEPLISNEQFGVGGVNSVRGYHEGQVFGDDGWHVTLEQATPAHLVGYVGKNLPLTVRGSVFTDYGDTYLIDPAGRADSTALWGTGFGGLANLGTHWEARFLFSVPLLKASGMAAYDPFFNFSLTAEF